MDHSRCFPHTPLGKLFCEAHRNNVSEKDPLDPFHTPRPRKYLKKKPPVLREKALYPSDDEARHEKDVSTPNTQHLVSEEAKQHSPCELQLPRSEPRYRLEDHGK